MIRPKLESWSIVLVGFWNQYIFRPKWISGRLTESKNISIEYPINNPTLPPRFRFDDINIRVSMRRLVISPETSEDATLDRIQNVATKVLTELPHTPLEAVGINFIFIENEPSPELLDIFEISDANALADTGFSAKSTSVRRELTFDEKLLNLNLILREDDKIIIDFNFHRDVLNADSAIEFLEEGILQFREKAFDVLRAIYRGIIET